MFEADEIGVYHCWNRIVRRSYFCGVDPHTGNDYSHRRDWLFERVKALAQHFAIDGTGMGTVPGPAWGRTGMGTVPDHGMGTVPDHGARQHGRAGTLPGPAWGRTGMGTVPWHGARQHGRRGDTA